MKLEITSKKENKLLKRTEIDFAVSHAGEATPSRISIRESIAGKLGCDSELVVISQFKTTFGVGKSQGVAHQYKKVEDLKSIEPKHIIKRFEPKPVKKKEEAPAEAPAETPSEASVEEAAKPEKSEEEKPAE